MTIRRVNVQTGKVEIINEDAPSFETPATAEDIKAEAQRRIFAIAPAWKQMNAIARSVELLDKGRNNLTTDEKVEVVRSESMWVKVKEIRAASNTLEEMDPIPVDYRENKHWP